MKRRTFTFISGLVLGLTLMFASCSKEGPEGPAGATGAQGPAGATGAQGPAGVANVIYSQWSDTLKYYLTSANSVDTVFGAWVVPALTADILNKGEIKVYANLNTAADPTVVPLPYSNANGAFIDVYFYIGGIEIVTNLNLDGMPLRYILIPGGTAARKSSPTLDWNDYAAVKKYLNLTD